MSRGSVADCEGEGLATQHTTHHTICVLCEGGGWEGGDCDIIRTLSLHYKYMYM